MPIQQRWVQKRKTAKYKAYMVDLCAVEGPRETAQLHCVQRVQQTVRLDTIQHYCTLGRWNSCRQVLDLLGKILRYADNAWISGDICRLGRAHGIGIDRRAAAAAT